MAPVEEAEVEAEPATEKANEADPASGAADTPSASDTKENSAEDDGGISEILEKISKLKEPDEGLFALAVSRLKHRLKAHPDDPSLLHNLGVVYSDMCAWEDAEESFLAAAEIMKKDNKASEATMYGLATSMTEQASPPKLLQAEAILRDLLDRAIAQHAKEIPAAIPSMYRAYVSLANNLESQKRWAEAADAWRAGVMIGSNMFGPNSDGIAAQRLALARAERLAKFQRVFRVVVWGVTIGLPVAVAYYYGKFDSAWAWLGYPAENETIAVVQ